MNFAKPGWIAWGNCSRCGRRFDTRRRTRALCPKCDNIISPRITKRESLELELMNFLHLFDKVEIEVIAPRAVRVNPFMLHFLYYIMRANLNYNSLLSEYAYYYPYC